MSNVYWVLTGPTSAGKTAALLRQAATRPMVAISADSRQVYQYMNIGTGTPTTGETSLLSHKVIDVISPLGRFNAHTFLNCAAKALLHAKSMNLEPWVVGGTGLYVRALVENLVLGSPPRPRLRAAIELLLDHQQPANVARHFGVTTPDSANPVRVTRAIENACNDAKKVNTIYQIAGLDVADIESDLPEKISQEDRQALEELPKWRCGGLVVIDPGKEDLLAKIQLRVETMFTTGLVEEVETLRKLGFGEAQVVTEGIGYREAGEILDGVLEKTQAIENTVIRTRQYAKRQRTYFKNMGWKIIHPAEFEAWHSSRLT